MTPSNVSLQDIIDQLDKIGAKLTLNGTRLGIRAPRGAVSAELKQEVYLLRAEIAEYIGEQRRHDKPRPSSPRLVRGIPSIWPTREWQTSTPEEQGVSSAGLTKLVEFGAANQMDSLLITRYGKVLTEAYYAPYKADIPHVLNSASKVVTSTLIAIACKEGLLSDLQVPVLSFFSDRKIANLDGRKKSMTIQHLLDMKSGIDWIEPQRGAQITLSQMHNSQDWVQFILDRPMSHPPGVHFSYNSGNAHLLSAIITKLTSSSALEFAQQHLFKSLGIEDVRWGQDPQNITVGGSHLYLRTRDMAKLGYLYLRSGIWEDKQMLPVGWVDQMSLASDAVYRGRAYANYFWAIPGKGAYMANGYHRQIILVLPDLDIVAAFAGRSGYSLEQLIDLVISSAVSDSPSPYNPASLSVLEARVRDAGNQIPLAASAMPALAKAISGKRYQFGRNALGLQSISLTFEDAESFYDATFGSGRLFSGRNRIAGAIGLDGIYREGKVRDHSVDAFLGNWEDENIFAMTRQLVGQGEVEKYLFLFNDHELVLRFEGSDLTFELLGRADDTNGVSHS
jgi:CubicO group peptidase (beta-lactamase class C family)